MTLAGLNRGRPGGPVTGCSEDVGADADGGDGDGVGADFGADVGEEAQDTRRKPEGKADVTVSDQAIEKIFADGGLLPTSVTHGNDEEMEWSGVDEVFSGRPEAVKFTSLGDTVTGVVLQGFTRQKRKFGTEELLSWDDGRPKMEAVLTIMTPDGARTLYVGSWRMENALAQAFAAAGVRGPRRGGRLVVRWSGAEPVPGGASPAKVFDAAYDPPGRKPVGPVESPGQLQLPFDSGEPPF
jgi:hypothetical protein